MAAGFLLALPAGLCLFLAGLGLSSPGFHMSLTWVLSTLFWLPRFGTTFLAFALVFLVVREWAVRTAQVPVDDEVEMLLNRVYPLRKQLRATNAPSAPDTDGADVEIARLTERAAP